ncbi:MAG: SAM-dependent methyltransferase [Clostridia bacterium]|nr:SAM-dependent methyltransferase [Clostridia bacterium]
MDQNFTLTPRLALVAALLGKGECVADIGSDHAYLPARLVLDGKFEKAIASDIVPGPVENARRTVEALGLSDRVEVRMAPGLEGIQAGEVDAVAIAGMGGEMIASILEAGAHLREVPAVVQPMTTEERLRKSLGEMGYEIWEEKLVTEGRRIYTVLRVGYTGKIRTISEEEAYLGRVYADNLQELASRYMEKKKQVLRKAAAGNRTAGHEAEADALEELLERLDRYDHRT